MPPSPGTENSYTSAIPSGPLEAFSYGVLDPRPGACKHNLQLLGKRTLGIEVTIPEFARRCGLGNIDPQHGGGNGIGSPAVTAIEACLSAPLPPAHAMLVTVRPDLDAFGSMALLALRRAGVPVGPAMKARIGRAADADRFDHGPWPGSRPLPGTCEEYFAAMNLDASLAALAGAMAARRRPARQRVGIAARWLETGAEPAGYRQHVAANAGTVIAGLRSGAIVVESKAGGRVATVISRLLNTLRLGYCLAPVVVALHPGDPAADPPALRRIVLAQYVPGHADFGAICADLASLEQGWGGSATILGSPQGRPCRLERETVLDAVVRHLHHRRRRAEGAAT